MNRIDRDTYELSTGRRLRANCGILGLDPDGGECPADSRLTHGYDDIVSEGATEMTPAERREIAECQIKLWAEWAAGSALPTNPGAPPSPVPDRFVEIERKS